MKERSARAEGEAAERGVPCGASALVGGRQIESLRRQLLERRQLHAAGEHVEGGVKLL